jgi:hypothetical protein
MKFEIVDLFSGSGGTSTGVLEAAAALHVPVRLTAVNHWATAVNSHSLNHPEVYHICEPVENLWPPRVIYLVPCVQVVRMTGTRWTPIIGPWHEDADIGVEQYHYHFDARFLPQSEIVLYRDHTCGEARILARVQSRRSIVGEHHAGPDNVPPAITYRKRRMRRAMLEFPDNTTIKPKLEKQFAGVKMKCLLCPHRGMPLNGLPVDAKGHVVCNGHGLKWDVATGEMIPR